jgi:hypothetical protein
MSPGVTWCHPVSPCRASGNGALNLHIPHVLQPGANLALTQLTFTVPGSFDLVFLSNDDPRAAAAVSREERLQQLSGGW